MATTDPTPHVPILQPGSLMCICGKRDNDYSAHPYGIVAAAKPGQTFALFDEYQDEWLQWAPKIPLGKVVGQ